MAGAPGEKQAGEQCPASCQVLLTQETLEPPGSRPLVTSSIPTPRPAVGQNCRCPSSAGISTGNRVQPSPRSLALTPAAHASPGSTTNCSLKHLPRSCRMSLVAFHSSQGLRPGQCTWGSWLALKEASSRGQSSLNGSVFSHHRGLHPQVRLG